MTLTLLPEWYPQEYVIITWPHEFSSWYPQYNQIQKTYTNLAVIIANLDKLVILAYSNDHSKQILKTLESSKANIANIEIKIIKTNDTWIRDYGPISCQQNNTTKYLEFIFNGYGNKYSHQYDNCVPQEMLQLELINNLLSYNIILEGGSIDTDGNGTLLTTKPCLLNPNRNCLPLEILEQKLKDIFNLKQIYWLENTYLAGDDTDGHIDNFARFIDPNTIFYSRCQNTDDEHYKTSMKLEKQLINITNSKDKLYDLIPIPFPTPIIIDNKRTPASYLNFLITNNSIIIPSFNSKLDDTVKNIFSQYFKNRAISFVDCRILIQQGGGIHCSTIQIAKK